MPDKNDKNPAEDRLTMPDTPAAISESAPGTPEAKIEVAELARDEAQEVIQAAQKRKAETLKRYVMALAEHRDWYDENREIVGMVNPDGEPLKDEIEASLIEVSYLAHAESPEELSEATQRKLEEAAALLNEGLSEEAPARLESLKEEMVIKAKDPKKHAKRIKSLELEIKGVESFIEFGVMGAAKVMLDPIEEKVAEMKQKIVELRKNPDYLLAFKKDEALGCDTIEVLDRMLATKSVHKALIDSEWAEKLGARAHFFDDIMERMSEIGNRPENEGRNVPTQTMAIFEFLEKSHGEISKLAESGAEASEIAKRMPAHMAEQFNLMFNCIAQGPASTYKTGFELGDTDAESMQLTLHTLNECLLALAHIQKTKKLIPALS